MPEDEEKDEWEDTDPCRRRSGDREGEVDAEGSAVQDIWDSRRWRVSCWEWRRRYFCRAKARSGSFRRGEEDADMVSVDEEGGVEDVRSDEMVPVEARTEILQEVGYEMQRWVEGRDIGPAELRRAGLGRPFQRDVDSKLPGNWALSAEDGKGAIGAIMAVRLLRLRFNGNPPITPGRSCRLFGLGTTTPVGSPALGLLAQQWPAVASPRTSTANTAKVTLVPFMRSMRSCGKGLYVGRLILLCATAFTDFLSCI